MADDAALGLLVERDFAATWWLMAEACGFELHDDDGLRWFHSGVDEPFLNVVVATNLADGDAEDRIASLARELIGRGARFIWWSTPSSRPGDLASILEALGLMAEAPWRGMVLPIDEMVAPPAVRGLEIRRVDGAAAYGAFESVFDPILSPSPAFTAALGAASLSVGFAEGAPMQHYVGILDDEPVATATLFTAGGAAGIYNVTTAEAVRRRGIGAAMTAHVVRRGGLMGMAVATLQASDMGRPVYERMGFRPSVDLVPHLVPRPEPVPQPAG